MKLLTIIFALLLTSQSLFAQEKVVESSAKKTPSWVGITQADHIIVSAEDATLDAAKVQCLANIRQSIISSVAVNISSKELSFDSQTIDGQQTDVLRRYESQVETVAAKLPFISGITLDDAEIYWKKIYNKREKSYKYEVHAKYPFSLLKRNSLVMEYLKIDREHNDNYQNLKQSLSTFTEIEFINRALNELEALYEYFIDQTRKNDVKALMNNYRKLYGSISIVPFSNSLGEFVYYLNLEGRRMTTSRPPILKSQYATNINCTPQEDGTYKITYNYDYCQPEDDNKIEMTQQFASGATRHTIYFDVSDNQLQIIPFGQIELDLTITDKDANAAEYDDQPVQIKGWLDLRSKYDTPFQVVHINFTADGTRLRIDSDLNVSFDGKGNHRLNFNAEGMYKSLERRTAMAQGVITVVNNETKKQDEIKFHLPYKIVIK
ncbi:MAG: hypothetical protein J6Q31_06400 [Alistipes sp.]|nr:hypothetical protein [Alistipes sp.]